MSEETRKMKVWPWIISGIGIFIIGFVLGHLFWGIYSATDDYKLFRDLLGFILSFMGVTAAVLGIVVHRLISLALDRKMDAKIKGVNVRVEAELSRLICVFYIRLSHVYWKRYEPEGFRVDQDIPKSEEGNREMAIAQSELALKRAERLDPKKFENHVCAAKNNLAYHLAMRKWPDDARKAIPLAKYAYRRASKYDFKITCRWVETYGFVLIRLGTAQQKKEGLEIIRKLLGRKDLDSTFREGMKKKYGKFLR